MNLKQTGSVLLSHGIHFVQYLLKQTGSVLLSHGIHFVQYLFYLCSSPKT